MTKPESKAPIHPNKSFSSEWSWLKVTRIEETELCELVSLNSDFGLSSYDMIEVLSIHSKTSNSPFDLGSNCGEANELNQEEEMNQGYENELNQDKNEYNQDGLGLHSNETFKGIQLPSQILASPDIITQFDLESQTRIRRLLDSLINHTNKQNNINIITHKSNENETKKSNQKSEKNETRDIVNETKDIVNEKKEIVNEEWIIKTTKKINSWSDYCVNGVVYTVQHTISYIKNNFTNVSICSLALGGLILFYIFQ